MLLTFACAENTGKLKRIPTKILMQNDMKILFFNFSMQIYTYEYSISSPSLKKCVT